MVRTGGFTHTASAPAAA